MWSDITDINIYVTAIYLYYANPYTWKEAFIFRSFVEMNFNNLS